MMLQSPHKLDISSTLNLFSFNLFSCFRVTDIFSIIFSFQITLHSSKFVLYHFLLPRCLLRLFSIYCKSKNLTLSKELSRLGKLVGKQITTKTTSSNGYFTYSRKLSHLLPHKAPIVSADEAVSQIKSGGTRIWLLII